MKWQQLLTNIYEQISQVLGKALEGLSVDDLNQQPHPDCNSVGWIAWHLTRVQDRAIADLTGEEQLWTKNEWHAKFNRPPDSSDTGFGHDLGDLAKFKSPDAQTLMAYHHAVVERTKGYISSLSETELNRQINHPRYPTVGARLVGNISDNLQHAGQAAYVHGLLKGKGWLV